MQEIFSPITNGFRFTADWYEYDGKPAEQAALKARNARAKELTKAGHTVRKFSLGIQEITRGGIGTNHPEVTVFCPVYGLNY
jgi:hypothetical protein